MYTTHPLTHGFISIDTEANAAYIYITEEPASRPVITKVLPDENVNLDFYTDDMKLAGIEILALDIDLPSDLGIPDMEDHEKYTAVKEEVAALLRKS